MYCVSGFRRLVLSLAVLALGPLLAWPQGTYTTYFPLSENPISEGGKWINGGTKGLDWANVRTTSGLANGTETGSGGYNDSTAVLTGSWGANQNVTAKIHSINQQTGSIYEEVEIRLRTTITSHSITGYEINFRCNHDGTQYTQIVRWNGPLGNFTYVASAKGPGIHDGDTVRATIVGSTISVYINSSLIFTGTDSTYSSGSPGLGFFLQGGNSTMNSDFGFTSYTATDGQRPAPPTNLMAVPR